VTETVSNGIDAVPDGVFDVREGGLVLFLLRGIFS
jgi:hypothetical protein